MSYSAYWKIRKQPFLINWKALGNAHEIMFCFNDIIQKTTIILGGYQSTLIAKPDNYMAGVAAPASLGFPLSVPAACGCHEIDHLKYLSYPMFRIPHLSLFVKYLTLTQKTTEAFLADAPHRDNRVFVFFRITGNFQPQNNFCITSYS